MHELDLHALLGQLIVILACQLLAMLTVSETQQPWRQRHPQQHLRPRWAPWERQRKWQVKRITGQHLLHKAVSISQDVDQLFVKSNKNHLKRADKLTFPWTFLGKSSKCESKNILWKNTYCPQHALLCAAATTLARVRKCVQSVSFRRTPFAFPCQNEAELDKECVCLLTVMVNK